MIDSINDKVSTDIASIDKKSQANWLTRLIRKIFGKDKADLLRIGRTYLNHLNALESVPAQVGTQGATYDQDIKQTEKIIEKLAVSKAKEVKTVVSRLKRRVIAAKYRHGSLQKTKINENDPAYRSSETYENLEVLCSKFKEKTFALEEKKLTDWDRRKLRQVLQYRELAELITEDPAVAGAFFKSVIRDKNSVKVFTQYVHVEEQSSRSTLSKRTGYFNRPGKKILKVEVLNGEKHLKLAYKTDSGEQKWVSLLNDGNSLNFNDKFSMTVFNLYKRFNAKKADIIGKVECFEGGVHNFNAKNCARWNGEEYEQIDFSKENWISEIPVFDTLSVEQAKKEYGEFLNGENSAVVALAARETEDLAFAGNHAFMKLLIPNKNGGYDVCSFGKYPKKFPKTTWQKLVLVVKSLFKRTGIDGEIHGLDQNVYCSHRRIDGKISYELTNEDLATLLQSIKEDVQAGLKVKKISQNIFHLRLKNCAEWVQGTLQKVLGDRVPNLYKTKILGGLSTYHPIHMTNQVAKGVLSSTNPLPKSNLIPEKKVAVNAAADGANDQVPVKPQVTAESVARRVAYAAIHAAAQVPASTMVVSA